MSEPSLIFFRLLWVSTILFGGLSISVMIFLCIRRAVDERMRSRRKAIVDKARQVLLFRINGIKNEGDRACLQQLTPKEIIGLAADISPLVKGENRSQLGSFLETVELRSWLQKRIRSHLPYRRIEAARWLENFQGEWSQSLLVDCLNDSVSSVRTTAAISLIRSKLMITTIIDALLNETTTQRSSTQKVLTVIADHAPEHLHAYLNEFAPVSNRRLLQTPLIERGYLPIAADLEKQLGSEQTEDRRFALSGLVKLKHPRFVQFAQRLMLDPSTSVREEAAQILSQSTGSNPIPALGS